MKTETTEVAGLKEFNLSNEIDAQMAIVLADKSVGIQKAFIIAEYMEAMDAYLTPEKMKSIMRLQGSKTGFKTDRDLMKVEGSNRYEKGPGYPIEVVKDCFIEMCAIGLLPVFNQWNIIGSNSYVTKEGAGTLLRNIPELQDFVILHSEITQSPDKKTASVKSTIKWTIDSEEHSQIVEFPVKSDVYTTFDSLIGKADRKSKIWLFNKIKGVTISDGDAEDAKIIDVTPSKPNAKEVDAQKTRANIIEYIGEVTTLEKLEKCYKHIKQDDSELFIIYDDKKRELSSKK